MLLAYYECNGILDPTSSLNSSLISHPNRGPALVIIKCLVKNARAYCTAGHITSRLGTKLALDLPIVSTLKIVKPGALLEILSSTAVTEAMDDDYEK